MSAPDTATTESGTFVFSAWSDGGARAHEIVVPATPATLTAHYMPG